MAPDADPYRTLELASGASIVEVKRAYRRLAKVHHPDAAGEKALPRFLAIQAAYEQLIGGLETPTGRRRSSSAPPRPWEADPDRSDATRRAYGGRAQGGDGTGARPEGAGATGGARPGGRSWSGRAGEAGSGSPRTGRRRRSEPRGGASDRPDEPSPGATDGPRRKATLGSTSYDGADVGPFEPDWGGASWYGTTSGTYWTLNPKEYADPRKHGPEYQARARRTSRAGGSATPAPTATPEAAADPAAAHVADPASGPASDPATGPAAPDPATGARPASDARPTPVTRPAGLVGIGVAIVRRVRSLRSPGSPVS